MTAARTGRGWVAAWPEEADAPAAVASGEVSTATATAVIVMVEVALGVTVAAAAAREAMMVEVVEVLAEGAEARVAEVGAAQAE